MISARTENTKKHNCIGSVTMGKVRTPIPDSSGTGASSDPRCYEKYSQVTHFIQERSSGWIMWVIKRCFNFAIFTYNTVHCEKHCRNPTRCFILMPRRSTKNILFYQDGEQTRSAGILAISGRRNKQS